MRLSTPPEGLLTYLFTDVEGSTRLWAADTAGTARSFEIHNSLIKDVVEINNGFMFGFAGDGFRASFLDSRDAANAAVQVRDGLASAEWNGDPQLFVRIGLHRGFSTRRGTDYFGPVVNTAARIEDAGNGGQILMSNEVAAEIGGPDGYELLWLGEHRLKDIADPVGIFQLGLANHRPLRVVNPNLSNLPNLGDSLIGRDSLVHQVRANLETHSLVTLTGTGGCGKTRLAIEIAYQELPNRSDGCYFADLISVSSADGLAPALARAVRLSLSGDDPMRQIADHLASRDALLVLDNCEHLVGVCARFAEDLMARGGKTTVLATSRERLNINGERIVQVTPLDLDGANGGAAVEFFASRALIVDPDFVVDPSNLADLIELCRQLDGMPLAIELAAARMSVLTVKDLSARMEDRLRLLRGSRNDAKGKRQTMQATLDWSYELLNPEEQEFFRALGVFVGPFSLEAATAVAGGGNEYESMDCLQSLVEKSLIAAETDQSAGRFRLLETVRYYASDRLDRENELGTARDGHLNYFHGMARTRSWTEGSDAFRADSLAPHWPNISSALEWAVVAEAWVKAGELALGSYGLWTDTVSPSTGVSWLETLSEPVEAVDIELGQWLRHHHAQLALQLDQFDVVHRIFQDLSENGLPGPRVQALAMHAFTRNRSDPQATLALITEGEEVAKRAKLGPESIAPLRWARANHALYDGDFEKARGYFGETYELCHEVGVRNTHFYISGLSYAATQCLTGQPAEALEILDREDWSKSVWDSSGVLRAVALLDLQRAAEAAEIIVQFSYDAGRGRLSRMANDALVAWAALAIHRDEPDHAWVLLQQAITPRTPFTIGMAEGLAIRIGKGEELRRLHRDRLVPLGQLDATEAMNNELGRVKQS